MSKNLKLTKYTRTLSSSNWSYNTQTIEIGGLSNLTYTMVTPLYSSLDEYTSCGVTNTSKGLNTLTFTCEKVPTSNIQISIVVWEDYEEGLIFAVDKTSISLSTSMDNTTFTVLYNGDGEVSVQSSDTDVVTVAPTSDRGVYEVTVVGDGDATITVSATKGSRPSAPSDLTISVDVFTPSFTLNDNSWDVISKVSESGQAANYWSVGDRKEITLNGTVGTLSLSNTTLYVYI